MLNDLGVPPRATQSAFFQVSVFFVLQQQDYLKFVKFNTNIVWYRIVWYGIVP